MIISYITLPFFSLAPVIDGHRQTTIFGTIGHNVHHSAFFFFFFLGEVVVPNHELIFHLALDSCH